MNRDLHKSPNLAPVGEYEPRELMGHKLESNLRAMNRGGTYEYEVGGGGGLCLGDEALLEMLVRHQGETVVVRRTH